MTTCSESGRSGTKAWGPDFRDVRGSCVRFGRLLRAEGLPVSQDRVVRWLKSLALLRCDHPADLYWSGRVNLVSAPAHLALYDELFRQFWLALDQPALAQVAGRDGAPPEAPGPRPAGMPRDDRGPEEGDRWHVGLEYRPPTPSNAPPAADDVQDVGLYSDTEVLREKDFAAYQGEDDTQLAQLLRERPEWLFPRARARRMRPALRGGLIDLRRSVADAVRHGGDPIRLFRRSRTLRWRKWLFLCDISASMSPYTRALLRFLQMVTGHRRATEVFLFGTRLTRVTPQLRRLSGAGTLVESVPDWHGGTRLGDALEQFQREYGQRGLAHGAVLFILSDGLDVGTPGKVGAVMAQIHRMAQRIIWVNPLKGSERYQPLARAMVEALPYVAELASGHSYSSLADVLRRQALAEP